jgi:hypothetical protein
MTLKTTAFLSIEDRLNADPEESRLALKVDVTTVAEDENSCIEDPVVYRSRLRLLFDT